MQDFERLGVFYLGRRYDLAGRKATPDLVLYDSKDLVTHALCVGMTGSGKTGLGIAVIEEAAIDGVPVIVIDPKGDLTNLLLTFPNLRPEDFAPWVNEDEARRAGKSLQEFAAAQADWWRNGLAEWGEDGARIQRLRDAADFSLYTPGSTAGIPVSILTSLERPADGDSELWRERVPTVVSSVLALVGISAEPLKSREHVLLSTILLSAWEAGDRLDFATLIQRVQHPPFTHIGVMDTDSFFPEQDRFSLAMSMNALIASPGFAVWTEGDPLDVSAFLRTSGGKPRVSIFTLAHLDDGQRMFFVALLLNAIAGWMRTQTGTSSLRAMVYMDEIFGFFPPVANPPSKGPLLTLLKQGRAAGVGVVLATQNPVDLDYKGLSNIGTWWLGRLQTDRDKARVLDGLESANDGGGFDRAAIDKLLSGITSRVFVMRNVHDDALTTFQSRWALSYLRGPLGRDEIKKLTAGSRPAASAAAATAGPRPNVVTAPVAAGSGGGRPVMPPGIAQYFSPDAAAAVASPLRPVLYGAASVRFIDPRNPIDTTRLVTLTTAISDSPVPVDWEKSTAVDWAPETLEHDPPDGAKFSELASAASKPKNYDAWTKQFAATLSESQSLDLLKSPSTGEVSRPDESERDFRARTSHGSRENRDRDLDAVRKKYAPRQAALDERLRRAQQAVQRESEQATGQGLQTAISVGATLVSALLGRKAINASTIGRATTAARGLGRTMKESEDIGRARETVAAIEEQRKQLDADFAAETAALDTANDVATETLEKVTIKPKKANITVKLVGLVWTK